MGTSERARKYSGGLAALPLLAALACRGEEPLAAAATKASAPSPPGSRADDAAARRGGWRLLAEDSPYLRQHGDNPVEWYAWGSEAFARARELDRPIFLSIGYSSCHWCHVMEHESFEDEGVAAYLNEHFVCIKVDREQRPDVDARYMEAVQRMIGSGGWPLSVFLTPEGLPFWGGTYFPPVTRGPLPSFRVVLEELAELWAQDRPALLVRASAGDPAPFEPPPAPESWEAQRALAESTRALQAALDPELGGLRSARPQRFPPSLVLQFLLRRSLATGAVDLGLVEHTLDVMAAAGLRDHVGGGFHRYCVDERWLVPHFEKMLYDNALLAPTYAEAHAVRGQERFARVARDTLRWVLADLASPEGLFYAARDADSLPFDETGAALAGSRPEEGAFYLWTSSQVQAVLGPEDAASFCRLFHVREQGNFEPGRSIARPLRTDEELSIDPGEGLPKGEAFLAWLEEVRDRLAVARAARPAPFRDEKCLAEGNGLLLSALSRCARLLRDESLAERAAALAASLHTRLITTSQDEVGRPRLVLHHQLFEGRASGQGDLADHAAVGRGLLDAYEATGEPALLVCAWQIAREILLRFEDGERGGFFTTTGEDPLLRWRTKDPTDGAVPAGQSVALELLLRLSPLDDSGDLRAAAERALAPLGALAAEAPSAFAGLLAALDAAQGPTWEIVLAGTPGEPGYEALLADARSTPRPTALLVPEAAALAAALVGTLVESEPLLLQGRRAEDGRATLWVCRDGVCELPVHAPQDERP